MRPISILSPHWSTCIHCCSWYQPCCRMLWGNWNDAISVGCHHVSFVFATLQLCFYFSFFFAHVNKNTSSERKRFCEFVAFRSLFFRRSTSKQDNGNPAHDELQLRGSKSRQRKHYCERGRGGGSAHRIVFGWREKVA